MSKLNLDMSMSLDGFVMLCDTAACGRDAGECPVANAARERFAS